MSPLIKSYLDRYKNERLPEEALRTIISSAQKGHKPTQTQLDCILINVAPAARLIASRYEQAGNGDDIFQSLLVHIIEKLNKFDLKYGTKFITWAYCVMKTHAQKYNVDHDPPSCVQQLDRRHKRAQNTKRLGTQPTAPPQRIQGQLVPHEGLDSADFHGYHAADIAHHTPLFSLPEIQEAVLDAIKIAPLSTLQRKILRGRCQGKTLLSIAEDISLSKERVRQILKESLEALRVWDIANGNQLLAMCEESLRFE